MISFLQMSLMYLISLKYCRNLVPSVFLCKWSGMVIKDFIHVSKSLLAFISSAGKGVAFSYSFK